MNNFTKKEEIYSNAKIYVDGIIMLQTAYNIVKHMDKDTKAQFGNDFVIDIRDMVKCFSLSFNSINKVEKLQYALDAHRLIGKIDVSWRIMADAKAITDKQFSVLALSIGSLMGQLKGWTHSINKNADGVLEPNKD